MSYRPMMKGYRYADPERLREKLRSAMRVLGGQNALARAIGVTHGHLSRVVRGEKGIDGKILDWLGYESITLYRRRNHKASLR